MQKLEPQYGMSNQLLMNHLEALRNSQAYTALTPAGSVMGTTSSTAIRIASTVTYTANSFFKSRTAVETLLTTAQSIPGSTTAVQEMIVVQCVDASGNITLVNGAIASGTGNALFPEQAAQVNSSGTQLTPVGYVRIATTTSGASFIGGTTLLNAASFTFTFGDIGPGHADSFLATQ